MAAKSLLLASLVLISATPALAQSPGADIQAQEDRWARAFNEGDLAGVAAMYAPGAWLVLPGGPPAKGTQAITATLGEMAKHTKNVSMHMSAVQPLGSGVVVENGTASFDTDEGAPNPKHSNYQVIWKRDRAGHWQIVRDIGSPL